MKKLGTESNSATSSESSASSGGESVALTNPKVKVELDNIADAGAGKQGAKSMVQLKTGSGEVKNEVKDNTAAPTLGKPEKPVYDKPQRSHKDFTVCRCSLQRGYSVHVPVILCGRGVHQNRFYCIFKFFSL